VALLAGCAGIGKQESDPWYAGASVPFYDELRYWPEEVAGKDTGEQCVPDAAIEFGVYDPLASGDDLWERVRAGFSIDGAVDERRVDRQLEIYADRQKFFDMINSRASWYLEYVVSELEERDMPLELALLPIVESGYNPGATSSSQAAGMWQIIPGTGRRLGLEQNGWYDGRRDVVASTEAALDYLSDLHKRFDGDWYLALAAYNAGEGSVQRAIERNRRLGKPTDYWSLPLSAQACNYVPRLLALSRVLEDPDEHGVEISPIPDRPVLASVEVSHHIDLRRAASHAGLDGNELLSLNPALRRGYTTPNATTTLLVPAEDREDFVAALRDIPAASVPTALPGGNYRIRPGDTLGSIARLYRTTPEALRQLNGMHDDRLAAGAYLKLPEGAVEPPQEFPTTASVELKNRGIYRVQRGDNLWAIARRVGVPATEIAALNGLGKNSVLQPGQSLRVRPDTARVQPSAQAEDTADGRKRISYTVRSGDSIARIASRFKVGVPELMRWNGIDARRPLIKPGQSLVLYIDPSLAVAGAG
jgi:membrane-bound lytic murein transglycosylase D